jgi:hypothetical protein
LDTVTNWNIQLVVADKIKNRNNESGGGFNTQTIPFYGVDDVVDIHANTLAIINDLTSFTQRSVNGLDIPDIIINEPFEDRFNNGLAGWVATFELTTHNDKNRCLFELIKPIGYTKYVIENCSTQQRYIATLNQPTITVGKVFTSILNPAGSTTYDNLVCYNVISETDNPDVDFVDLPVLPPGELDSCEECQQWITPGKIWITTPGKWNEQYQTWSNI